ICGTIQNPRSKIQNPTLRASAPPRFIFFGGQSMNVLVTGGAGYIGSHAALRLLEDGHAVTIVDDLSRGNIGALHALEKISASPKGLHFEESDIGDRPRIEALLKSRRIDVVMHFAALTYVGESMQEPLRYWRNNAMSSLALLEAMDAAGIKCMVFSSSAAVYGEPPPEQIPIKETCPQNPINPYGKSKLAVERMLADYAHAKRTASDDFAFAALRYFNVAGNDEHCRVGADHDPETPLIPSCL